MMAPLIASSKSVSPRFFTRDLPWVSRNDGVDYAKETAKPFPRESPRANPWEK